MIVYVVRKGYKLIAMTDTIPNPRYKEELKQLAKFEQRAHHADVVAALAILAKAPERSPLPGDEIIADH